MVCQLTVYPRWRGEHIQLHLKESHLSGLSPLARGTQVSDGYHTFNERFIPAGAGNTSDVRKISPSRPVYPRWRGEHAHGCHHVKNSAGLSPLARGTRRSLVICAAICRFIPAGAGNTTAESFHTRLRTVYPRWRGEHHFIRRLLKLTPGLSPLARGTRRSLVICAAICRFIPAGAGNTYLTYVPAAGPTVYPRWRGEHPFVHRQLFDHRGLSPLARGTLESAPRDQTLFRFIPAGAGNTIPSVNLYNHITVYPRWRGEHIMDNACDSYVYGLSPLARGTRFAN